MAKYLPHYEDCAAERLTAELLIQSPGCWEDLRFPASGINPLGAASDPTRSTTTGLFGFSASATNILAGVAQVPHAWEQGTAIHPHIHWMPDTNAGGNVLWLFEWAFQEISGVWDLSTYEQSSKTVAAGTVARKHLLTAFTSITPDAESLSCCIHWRLSRVGGDAADTYAGVAHLIELDFHYQADQMGSAQEFVKR